MNERTLYPKIIDGAMSNGWPLYRIPDDASGRKPFDVIGAAPNGRAVGLEIKVVRPGPINPHAVMPWNLFATHQRAWLKLYCKCKAIALIGLMDQSTEILWIFHFQHFGLEGDYLGRWAPCQLTLTDGKYVGWNQIDFRV